MRNLFYFYLPVSDEQVAYTKSLVEYSLQHHRIPNIWDSTSHAVRTVDLRFTGTLGEVVFADTYRRPRPVRSFGADDGQDLGIDFVLPVDGQPVHFDLKSMRRKTNIFYADYVLNIPASQLHRSNSRTDCYFHINLHEPQPGRFIATFVGYINKNAVLSGEIGHLFAAGAVRTRGNQTTFQFHTDTYEVLLQDFTAPPVSERIRGLEGYGEGSVRG